MIHFLSSLTLFFRHWNYLKIKPITELIDPVSDLSDPVLQHWNLGIQVEANIQGKILYF